MCTERRAGCQSWEPGPDCDPHETAASVAHRGYDASVVRSLWPLVVILLGTGSAASAEPQILRFGTIAPEGSPWMDSLAKIGAEIAKQSHGSLQLRGFPSALAGDEGMLASQLERGQLDIAGLSGGALFELLPEATVLELPFLFRNKEEAERVVRRVLPDLRACAARRGLWLIGVGHIGFRHLGTRVPIQTLADLRAVKMRSQPSPSHRQFWDALGVRHQPIGVPDVVRALEAGEVDAIDGALTWVFASAWHQQIKHFTLTGHIFQPAVVIAGKKGAAMVPLAVRNAVDARTESSLIDQNAKQVREVEAALENALAGVGVTVHPMPAALEAEMRRLTAPLIEDFRRRASPSERRLLGVVEVELARIRRRR